MLSSRPMDQEDDESSTSRTRRSCGVLRRGINSHGDGSGSAFQQPSETLLLPRSLSRQNASTLNTYPIPTFYSRSSNSNCPSSIAVPPRNPNDNVTGTCRPPRPLQFRVEHVGAPSMCIYRLKLPDPLCDNIDRIKQLADEYAETLPRGWATAELYSLTRQDLAVRDVPALAVLVQPIWSYILDAIRYLFQGGDERVLLWDRYQPHILKYSIETGHKGVQLHHDHCSVTANLALSSLDDYVGGGTLFPDVGPDPIHLERGEFLLHPGSRLHGGKDIQQGSRYLMVMFVHIVP